MKIPVTPIPPDSFTAFQDLSFKTKSSSRHVSLEDVLPNNPGLSYCAIFTEAFIKLDGKDKTVTSFQELFDAVEKQHNVSGLESVRQSGKLYEGRKLLPKCVTKYLTMFIPNSKTAFIRCTDLPSTYAWSAPLKEYLEADDILIGLPHRFGEFEISDESNSWYLRIRDDDPVIFFAGTVKLVDILISECCDWVMKVPPTLIYAD